MLAKLGKVGVAATALVACAYLEAHQNTGSPGTKPIIIATLARNQTIRPVVTISGERLSSGWPDDVVGTAHEFPMPLTSIPKDWISPVPTAPTSWRLYLSDGRRLTVGAVDVVTLPGDSPVEAAIRTTPVSNWSNDLSGVATAGGEVSVNFIQRTFGDTEVQRFSEIARRLTIDDILREMSNELGRLAESERAASYRPSRKDLLGKQQVERSLYRPERSLADGVRPVLVDYMLRFDDGTEQAQCLTSIHVQSWFHEGPRGMVRALGSEIGVDFGCDYLTVDTFPEAVVQIGSLELWLGQTNYEDGFDYDAYHFRNGRLESVRWLPIDIGGASLEASARKLIKSVR